MRPEQEMIIGSRAGFKSYPGTESGQPRRRTFQLVLVAVAAMAGMFARAALGPVQEVLQRSLALTDNQMALLQGPALAAPLLLFSIPLGYLIDRYSRRNVLLWATLCNAGATLAGGCTHTFAMLFLTRCVIGLCAPATAVAAYSLLADLYDTATRGRATTLVVLSQIAGTASAFSVGGAFLALVPSGPDSWRAALMLCTVLLLLPLAVVLAIDEPRRSGHTPQALPKQSIVGEMWALRDTVITLVIGMAMVSVADGAALVWTAPTLTRNFGLLSPRAGQITGVSLLIGGAAGPLLGGPLADVCQKTGGPRRTTLLLGILGLASALAAFYSVVPTARTSIFLLVLFLLLGSAMSVIVITLCIVVVPNELRGTTVALQSGAGAVFGLGLAPLFVSELSSALGGPAEIGKALATVCAMTSLLGGIVFLRKCRHLPAS